MFVRGDEASDPRPVTLRQYLITNKSLIAETVTEFPPTFPVVHIMMMALLYAIN